MILVAGGSGQVGQWLAEVGPPRIRTVSSRELDVTDAAAALSMLEEFRPEWVINCAAHTAVDAAEEEPDRARSINALGAENLARAASHVGSRFLQLSTDYVFGELNVLQSPLTEGHPCAPLSTYGLTKLEGEKAVREAYPDATIVRTAWVYTGPARRKLNLPGNDFVTTMVALEESHDEITVVNDQVGSPTFARDLAVGLIDLVETGAARGETVHAAGAGRASWYEVARAVFEEIGADPNRVRPCRTVDFPRPARRPAFSVLSSAGWERAGLSPLPHWRGALQSAITTTRSF